MQSCGYTQLLHISDDVMSWTRFSNYRLFARGMYAYNSIYLIIVIHFVNTVNSPFYIVVYTYSSNNAPELYIWRILNGFIMSCKKKNTVMWEIVVRGEQFFFRSYMCYLFNIYIYIYIYWRNAMTGMHLEMSIASGIKENVWMIIKNDHT